jgi:hypothetical protein
MAMVKATPAKTTHLTTRKRSNFNTQDSGVTMLCHFGFFVTASKEEIAVEKRKKSFCNTIFNTTSERHYLLFRI